MPPKKITTRLAFASTVPIKSELVCEKKNLKRISKGIARSLIAKLRGERTYPENKINRWRITRRCAAPQAKPAVSRDICGEPWPGSGHYGRTSRGEANTCEALALSNVKKYRCDPFGPAFTGDDVVCGSEAVQQKVQKTRTGPFSS